MSFCGFTEVIFLGIQKSVQIHSYVLMIRLTVQDFVDFYGKQFDSSVATIGSIYNIFATLGSIYHLMYMCLLKFYAIVQPISSWNQSKRSVFIGLGILWITVMLLSSAPGKYYKNIIVKGRFSKALQILGISRQAKVSYKSTYFPIKSLRKK